MAEMNETNDYAAAFAGLVERVMQADDLAGEIEAEDGTRYEVARHDPPGLVLAVTPVSPGTGRDVDVRVFELGDERPTEFPDAVPLLPGTRAWVSETAARGRRLVLWSGLADAKVAAERLRELSLEDGWREERPGGPVTLLRRGLATRSILHGALEGRVQLMDFEPPAL